MQQALHHRLPADTHIFNDVLDIFGDGSYWKSRIMQEKDYHDKLELVWRTPRATTGYCVAHGRHCSWQTHCSARIGGTPCQDFSTAGLQRGVDGEQLCPLLGFGAKSAHTRTPIVGLECVEKLPCDVVRDAFGESYSWPVAVHTAPEHAGFHCTNRRRPGDFYTFQLALVIHGTFFIPN